MRKGVVCVAVVVAAALAAGCGGRRAAPPRRPGPPVAVSPAGPPAGSPGGARTVITVIGKDNFYEPATLSLRPAADYEVHFKNEGMTVHNLIFQTQAAVGRDFASDIAVSPGAESIIPVRIDRAGTYRFVCTYHPEMVGEARVGP